MPAMFGPLPDSASATYFFVTDHRSTDRTTADAASTTPTAAVRWVFARRRVPRPPAR